MKILSRYVGVTVVSSILLVTIVLVGIQSFIQLAAQLQDVGKGNYGLWQAFAFVPLMLPSDLYQLFPMAALVGSLMGLGRLAAQNELVVMRTSGMSKWQVVQGVLLAAMVLLVMVSLIGELVGPHARDYALRMKSVAVTKGQSLHTSGGTWVRDHDQFIHIKKLISGGELLGVTRYQFSPKHRLLVGSYAKKGVYHGDHWVFTDVQQSQFKSHSVEKNNFKQQIWPLRLTTDEFLLSKVDPNQLTLLKLYQYLHFRKHSGMGIGVYAFGFWKRILQPFATIVMILLAIPVVFGPLRHANMGIRILTGVVFGFSFYILNQFLGPFSLVYQVPPALAAALPTILFALLAGFLLKSEFRSF